MTFDDPVLRVSWPAVPTAASYLVDVLDAAQNPAVTIAAQVPVSEPRFEWTPGDTAAAGAAPTRHLILRVWSVSREDGTVSDQYTEAQFDNPPPPVPQLRIRDAKSGLVIVTITNPLPADLHEIQAHLITPGGTTQVYAGTNATISVSGLDPTTTYTLKVTCSDVWVPTETVQGTIVFTPGRLPPEHLSTVPADKVTGQLDPATLPPLDGGGLSGVLPIANGGTGASTAAEARANLGITNPSGASGSFTTADGKTVTVANGLITSIA